MWYNIPIILAITAQHIVWPNLRIKDLSSNTAHWRIQGERQIEVQMNVGEATYNWPQSASGKIYCYQLRCVTETGLVAIA